MFTQEVGDVMIIGMGTDYCVVRRYNAMDIRRSEGRFLPSVVPSVSGILKREFLLGITYPVLPHEGLMYIENKDGLKIAPSQITGISLQDIA